jgi:hypothetical protein
LQRTEYVTGLLKIKKIKRETEAFLLSQITGLGSMEYTAKTSESISVTSAETAILSAAADNLDYQTILSKVNNGQQLTSAELAVLKEKNPAAYAKAMRTNTARQELVSEMEKSPNQAHLALNEALSSLSEENDEERATLTKALTAEYNNFVSKHDQVIISSSLE